MIGSQAILGSYAGGALPQELTLSREADLAIIDDTAEAQDARDITDAMIGEESHFDATFGV